MKRSLAIVLGLLLLFSTAACSNVAGEQIVQTGLYQISVPKDWGAEKLEGNMLLFKQDNGKIGGLDILGYDPDQPLSQLEPNHSEVLESKKLEGFFTEVLKEKLKIIPPAASGAPSATEEIHLFFIMKEQKNAYDLYFDTSRVDEQTALTIAKSFKLAQNP
ncbi:Beta-lactamase regulatory protein 1 [[Clostridium] ultunense Esp]|uniref:hypothetical protein n=1 Tax=Thermicanus aegyptius TaxID=94009 RepID=UPI0002B700C5|nr:hypothetical protein [Thermicanus aegyptius]CCQ96119.1 Beta-lactamase regulatory protein 1 [[Clostridium] ultunense Esp]